MPHLNIPHHAAAPPGLEDLRGTILSGVTSLDVIRAAKACGHEAWNTRRKLTLGEVHPQHVAHAEDRVVSLAFMEGVLANLCGALQAAEAAGPPPDPFVSIGDAARRVLSSLDPAAAKRHGRRTQEVYGHD